MDNEGSELSSIVACWDCGSVREGKINSCTDCGSRSSLSLLEDQGLGNGQPLRVPEAVKGIMRGWDFKLQGHILNQLTQYALQLKESKHRLKASTWVSVPLLLPDETMLIIMMEGEEDVPEIAQSSMRGQWSISGSRCKDCGRTEVSGAEVITKGEGKLILCTGYGGNKPLVKKSWTHRSVLDWNGVAYAGGVPIRTSTCQDKVQVQVSLSIEDQVKKRVRDYRPYVPKRREEEAEDTNIDILMTQVGGGTECVEELENWILGSRPDIAIYQELWDLELQGVPWLNGYQVFEGVKGQGLGLAVTIAFYLRAPGGEAWKLMDEESCLLVAFEASTGGIWVVGSVHLRPGAPYADKIEELRKMTMAARSLEPEATFIGGDFNCQCHLAGSPLEVHMRSGSWKKLGLNYVGKKEDITHRVKRNGSILESAIDHGFAGGQLGESCSRELLPGTKTHLLQLFKAKVPAKMVKPFEWKRYKWRQITEEVKDAVMAAIEVLWYWVLSAHGTSDNFLGAYHAVADAFAYRDPQAMREQFLNRIRKEGMEGPTRKLKLSHQEARDEFREWGLRLGDEEKVGTGITSATRTHLKISKAALVLYGGIKASEEDQFIDVSETMKEISDQAQENNRYRGVPMNKELLQEYFSSPANEANCLDRLPDQLWIAMKKGGLDPTSYKDRVQWSRKLVSEGYNTERRLMQSLKRSATNATSLDLIPSSQLKAGGWAAKGGIMRILDQLEAGGESLFNTVAQYGLKKRGPYFLMGGFRHIFVESSISSKGSARYHFLMRDVGELTGLWGPTLFSYRQGFSAHTLAIVTRRALYKILQIWGKVWLLEWDETGAFPRLQMGLLDELTEIASEGGLEEALWTGGKVLDQFYRRQQLYPVTEYGLGLPYQAQDGALEGDCAAPSAYQSASAVRTWCKDPQGAVTFGSGDKQISISETVFSDDRRMFHYRQTKFEGLVGIRLDTTQAVGGIVKKAQLNVTVAELDAGEINMIEAECQIDGSKQSTLEPPKVTGIPLFLGKRPDKWLDKLLGLWKSLSMKVEMGHLLPIKSFRVIFAFMVSSFDFVASGLPMEKQWLKELQLQLDKLFTSLHGLSMRTAKLFLYLPDHMGGVGCPWLIVRADLRFLRQVLGLQFGRSVLGNLVGEELMDPTTAGGDASSVRSLMEAYKLEELKIRAGTTERPELQLAPKGPWILNTDGGLKGDKAGIGIVIAKGTHIYYVKGYSLLVHAAHSTCIEGIAKATALRVSNGLEGDKMAVADSAGAAFSGGKLPNYGTWVDPLIREAYCSIQLDLYAETWVEAQHDSGAKAFLAYCNKLTDSVATEEMEKAKINEVYLPEEWVTGPVYSIKGKIVVDLSASLD